MDAFLCVDKPEGPSSSAIVTTVKRALKCKKAGHSGTLDPGATGLLLLALDNATRLFPYMELEPKVYEFSIQFGYTTDTLDSAGTIIEQGEGPVPGREDVARILPRFIGKQIQQPPRYSALKVDGVRAYRRARAHQDFEISGRSVHINRLDILGADTAGRILLRVECSTGTYVRALARDIAAALNTCGYAATIRRTAIGIFTLDSAVALRDIDNEHLSGLISVKSAFEQHRCVYANEKILDQLRFGRKFIINHDVDPDVPILIFDRNDKIVAVAGHVGNNMFQPIRVFVDRNHSETGKGKVERHLF